MLWRDKLQSIYKHIALKYRRYEKRYQWIWRNETWSWKQICIEKKLFNS